MMNSSLLLRLVYLGCIIASTICAVSFELTPFRQAMTEPVGGSAARKQEQGDDGVRTAPSHPEKRIALVHIGPFKAASTSIQHDICRYEQELAGHNWTVPYCPECSSCVPAHGLARQILGDSNPPAILSCGVENQVQCFAKALASVPEHNSVIFSSEFFVRFSSKQSRVKQLKALLADFPQVKIVYVHRTRATHILSACNQQIKDRKVSRHSFERCFLQSLGNTQNPNYHPEMLEAYAEVFGRENVYLMSLDRIVERGVSPFRALVEIEPSLHGLSVQESDKANTGIDGSVAQLISLFRTLLQTRKVLAGDDETTLYDHVWDDCFKRRLMSFANTTSLPRWCIDTQNMLESWLNFDYAWCERAGLSHHYFQCTDTLREVDSSCFVDTDALMSDPKTRASVLKAVDLVADRCRRME